MTPVFIAGCSLHFGTKINFKLALCWRQDALPVLIDFAERAAAMTVHSSFYASQLASLLVWSGLVRVMTGRHLHALCAGAVLTRPPWLSARWLLLLDKHRSSVFAALPVVLAAAAVWPSSWPVRLTAAVAVSLSLIHI